MNIARDLMATIEDLGPEPAVVDRRGRVTSYAALGAGVIAVAARLRTSGVEPGDRVLIETPPSPALIEHAIGAIWMGAVPCFIEPGFGDAVYRRQVDHLAPSVRLADPSVATIRRVPGLRPMLDAFGVQVPPATTPPSVRRRITATAPNLWEAAPGDAALTVTTGGTTDRPRHVVHTHRSVRSIIERVERIADGARSVGVDTAPQLLGAVALGLQAHLIGGGGRRRARRLQAVLRANAIDTYFGAPSTWLPLLEAGQPIDSTVLSHVVLGGAPVTGPFLTALRRFLAPHVRISVVYGLTEHGPVTWIDGAAKAAFADEGDLVGEPLPGVRVELEGAEVVVDGQHTGDRGRIVEIDGRPMLVLLGRSKNMIIRNGVNLYPELLEPLVLEQLGRDLDLREVAFVGVHETGHPDESVVCWYAPALDPHRVRRHIESALGRAAWPDRYVARNELPRLGRQGKLDRTRMRTESVG